ncbi:MAG: PEGA domain-containing protein [Acidobacteriia bacterium]|nr:PEGA domain-containing protein [Terriglobia bacterium]
MRSILWIGGLLAAHACLAQHTVAMEHKTSHAARPTDPFLSGAPFTLDQTLNLLRQDAIPLRRRKEAIQSRGVDFSWSQETIEKLKATGASAELLELIESKARPAPAPPAPKPAPVGSISLKCAPTECNVAVNGHAVGSTLSGTLELARLAPGKWVVDLSKNGYISRQSSVLVDENKTATVSAVLEPDRTTEETFGTELFRKMVQALGGEDGIQELGSVEAAGSATILTRDGTNIRWSLRMRNRPDRGIFQAKAGKVAHEVMFSGNEFMASKSLKGQDALELPADFGYLRDNQPAALIARLEKPRYKMVAKRVDPEAGGEFVLFAEGGTDKISIGLDSDMRPQRVRIETETGVGSLLITYSDYVQTGQAWYPKSMQAKPDGQPHGIQVHFDTVELNLKFKDSDFKLKGGIFSNFYN